MTNGVNRYIITKEKLCVSVSLRLIKTVQTSDFRTHFPPKMSLFTAFLYSFAKEKDGDGLKKSCQTFPVI